MPVAPCPPRSREPATSLDIAPSPQFQSTALHAAQTKWPFPPCSFIDFLNSESPGLRISPTDQIKSRQRFPDSGTLSTPEFYSENNQNRGQRRTKMSTALSFISTTNEQPKMVTRSGTRPSRGIVSDINSSRFWGCCQSIQQHCVNLNKTPFFQVVRSICQKVVIIASFFQNKILSFHQLGNWNNKCTASTKPMIGGMILLCNVQPVQRYMVALMLSKDI